MTSFLEAFSPPSSSFQKNNVISENTESFKQISRGFRLWKQNSPQSLPVWPKGPFVQQKLHSMMMVTTNWSLEILTSSSTVYYHFLRLLCVNSCLARFLISKTRFPNKVIQIETEKRSVLIPKNTKNDNLMYFAPWSVKLCNSLQSRSSLKTHHCKLLNYKTGCVHFKW